MRNIVLLSLATSVLLLGGCGKDSNSGENPTAATNAAPAMPPATNAMPAVPKANTNAPATKPGSGV
ncbi:MAG TPA: hypothetical protein VNV43_12135 [Candidatus Acidoferrales bacterium]|nr:hypothetical protein [Candidatus Acidoferrales bacterium]